MEQDFQKQLGDLKKLVKENQRLLKKLRRSQIVSHIKSLVYIIFILIIGFSFFKAVQPQLQAIQDVTNTLNIPQLQGILPLAQ